MKGEKETVEIGDAIDGSGKGLEKKLHDRMKRTINFFLRNGSMPVPGRIYTPVINSEVNKEYDEMEYELALDKEE